MKFGRIGIYGPRLHHWKSPPTVWMQWRTVTSPTWDRNDGLTLCSRKVSQNNQACSLYLPIVGISTDWMRVNGHTVCNCGYLSEGLPAFALPKVYDLPSQAFVPREIKSATMSQQQNGIAGVPESRIETKYGVNCQVMSNVYGLTLHAAFFDVSYEYIRAFVWHMFVLHIWYILYCFYLFRQFIASSNQLFTFCNVYNI